MVFGFIKLCRKLAMSQVFFKKYVYIKLSLFFHPCSTFYPVSPCQGFLLMVQSKRMPLGKHYQYCCKADAPTAKKKNKSEREKEWEVQSMIPLSPPQPAPSCHHLSPSMYGRPRGLLRQRRRRSVFFSGKERGSISLVIVLATLTFLCLSSEAV